MFTYLRCTKHRHSLSDTAFIHHIFPCQTIKPMNIIMYEKEYIYFVCLVFFFCQLVILLYIYFFSFRSSSALELKFYSFLLFVTAVAIFLLKEHGIFCVVINFSLFCRALDFRFWDDCFLRGITDKYSQDFVHSCISACCYVLFSVQALFSSFSLLLFFECDILWGSKSFKIIMMMTVLLWWWC